jgi:hypothetical protein
MSVAGMMQEAWDQQLKKLIADGIEAGVPWMYWSLLEAAIEMNSPDIIGDIKQLLEDYAARSQRSPSDSAPLGDTSTAW